MIWELIQSLTTPANPVVKKLGFLNESIGMEARYQRCQKSWDPHYQQCQQVILKAASEATQQNTLLILGAGSLRDIPLKALSESFKKVLLVDLLFLKSARKRAKPYSNVSLLEIDVSNSLPALLQTRSAKDYIQHLIDCPPKLATLLGTKVVVDTIDCIVSLNLVTQIPLMPVVKCAARSETSPEQLADLAELLVQQHLSLLTEVDGVKCLIADQSISEYDRQQKLVDCHDPGWGVSLPIDNLAWSTEWEWEMLPFKESGTGLKQVHSVSAFCWA